MAATRFVRPSSSTRPADPTSAAIANRIRESIAALSISERELARRAGFASENHVNTLLARLEAGAKVEVTTLVALAEATERSLQWLATGDAGAEQSGVRLRDVRGWTVAAASAAERVGEGALSAVGDSRWPTAPRMSAELVVALARAWSDATN